MTVPKATAHLDQVQILAALQAFRRGDFSARLPHGFSGIDGEIAATFNEAIELAHTLTREIERVGNVIGKQGKTAQRARLPNAAGSWKANAEAINTLLADIVRPTEEIARVIGAVANGDLSQTVDLHEGKGSLRGEFHRIGKVVNSMVAQLDAFVSEVTRVAREVGTEGKLGGQAKVPGVAGTWKELTDNVNAMAANLTNQVRNIADVTTAVARGDLSKKITASARGEVLELKSTINTMVDQLNSFASEVTRVSREVGTEGKLGGQANVEGVAGTWKDLTDSVNLMAANLTGQVRGIADLVSAVAQGDLTHKLTVDARGEIASLAETINGMIETLATFGDQVTNVAREVGIEGKLGGQARVPGAAGLWRNLTNNVNQLAANLTTQVRAIAEVSTAVAKGDLTRFITVEASGEVAALKDNINQMIRNLKDRTQQLFQAQKMEAIGQLTGGIAHDFNNLLAVILGNLDLLKKDITLAGPRAQRHLDAIRYAAERSHRLTRQLLAFSRRQHLSPDTLDIAGLVRGFEPFLRRAIGETVTLEVSVPESPTVCEVDPAQLETALLNLAVNARDAMPEGGRLSIVVQSVQRADELVASSPEATPGPWHIISIRDTGSGMSRAVIERAFEPFFTTKEIGKGSGLGLSQVYGFVRQSGGFVMLNSEVGQGTEITMYLPPSTNAIAVRHLHSDSIELKHGRGESVLIVEDDPGVLALAIELLNGLGYRVLTASDSAGALEILKRGDHIDLIFTDVVMPGGRTGVQLATEARALRPTIKVLLTSGYTGEALARHQPKALPLIEKPFREGELAMKLREVLEGRIDSPTRVHPSLSTSLTSP